MNEMEVSNVMIGPKRGARRRRPVKLPVPLNAVLEQPYVRITRNGVQITLTRDALAALGRPSHIIWLYDKNTGFIRLVSSDGTADTSYRISYSKSRPSAVASVPKSYLGILKPGKYMVVSWSEGENAPKWIQFGTVTNIMNLERKGEK